MKSALIREIGGKHVRVSVEGTDRFGRRLGIVTHKGRDIGEWLVREGHAIAAYGDRASNERRAKPGAACGRTPTTSIPETTGTGSECAVIWRRPFRPS